MAALPVALLGDQIVPGGDAGTSEYWLSFGVPAGAARDDLSPSKAKGAGSRGT
ncbi:hypothetical protein [Kibdelosporangium philippinense]|uniref:hypothetical protein n=1 Tax=Kibdelosporangium philippinense TaxID=211113 RepID=UPI00360AFD62